MGIFRLLVAAFRADNRRAAEPEGRSLEESYDPSPRDPISGLLYARGRRACRGRILAQKDERACSGGVEPIRLACRPLRTLRVRAVEATLPVTARLPGAHEGSARSSGGQVDFLS